jgi:hypothetical protein
MYLAIHDAETSRSIARQRLVDKPDKAGELVLGNMLGHFLAQGIGVERFSRFQEDGCGHFFTHAIIGNAKYAALCDGGVAIDGRLDLDAIDILTTAQHHVFLASTM